MKAALLKVTGGLFLTAMLQACGQANTGTTAAALGKPDADFAVSGNGQMTMAAQSDDGVAVAECQESLDQSSVLVQNEYDVKVFIRKIEVDGKAVLRARLVGKNSKVKVQFDDQDTGYVDLTQQATAQATGTSNGLSAVIMAGFNLDKTLGLSFSWSFNSADPAQVKLESGSELSLLLDNAGLNGSASGTSTTTLGQQKAAATTAQTTAAGSADISAPTMTCQKSQ